LGSIPVGNYVHSVELKPGRGGQLMRAYNSSALLLRHMVGYSILKLKSGEHRRLSSQCMATLGVPTRVLHKERQEFLRRAGLNRYKGRRPHVRGCAMNPVDHPHGGNTSSKFGSFTPWGKVAKGVRTASRYRPGRDGILKYRVRNYDARIEKLNKK
jgi:large subunit ribosomal protein L2